MAAMGCAADGPLNDGGSRADLTTDFAPDRPDSGTATDGGDAAAEAADARGEDRVDAPAEGGIDAPADVPADMVVAIPPDAAGDTSPDASPDASAPRTCGAPSADDQFENTGSFFTISMWAFGPHDVWMNDDMVNLMRWDRAWLPQQSGTQRNGQIRASGPNDVWIFRPFSIDRWNGTNWSTVPPPTTDPNSFLLTLWAVSPNDAWAINTPSPQTATTRSTLRHWDGTVWSAVASPLDSAPSSFAPRLWGSASNDVWASATGILLHWNGTAWTASALPAPAAGATDQHIDVLWGTSARDVWAGGGDSAGGKLWHFDGTAWSSRGPSTPDPFTVLWGSCPTHYWASTNNSVWRYDGAAWTQVAIPPDATGTARGASAIAGNGPDDVWVNVSPRMLHYRPGTCGDGVLQRDWEGCDDPGSQFCRQCGADTECADCFSVHCGGDKVCAGKTGTPRVQCQALLSCLTFALGTCFFQGAGPTGNCYCSDPTCSVPPNGRCVAEYEAVAGSHDPAEVLRQLADPSSDIARLTAESSCFGHTPECGFHCRTK